MERRTPETGDLFSKRDKTVKVHRTGKTDRKSSLFLAHFKIKRLHSSVLGSLQVGLVLGNRCQVWLFGAVDGKLQ